MTTQTRLSSIAPDLARRFLAAPHEKQRAAALAAARRALFRLGPADADARIGLREAEKAAPDLKMLESKSEAFDEAYFDASDELGSDAPETIRLFSLARGFSAIALALSTKPEDLHEAVYEAMMSADDHDAFVGVIESALG